MKGLLLACLSLAALAVATPIAKRQGVTPALLDQFDLYAQWAAAASCNSEKPPGAPVTCAENTCPTPESHGATVVASFAGAVLDTRGFVAVDPVDNLIVVSFRGSTSIRNWIGNLIFVQSPCDLVSGCLVHTGFMASWLEVADETLAAVTAARTANPTYNIRVTGYSLGGAVGTLAAAFLREAGFAADLYTYGSPRVGNEDFVEFVTNQAGSEYRITHQDDPVPRLPPIVANYRHVSPEYWVDPGADDIVTVDEVEVCPGFANTDCNGGTTGFDVDDHSWYFGPISACSPDGVPFRTRANANDMSDAELEAQLNEWVKLDKELAKQLNK
ncbi:Fungal lipase-like domain-containing protein [Madurella fahalii]|uniref:Fungal lipase-like domain-containing protein n=1 Tax=Madurella fahalii TaxID=1157608 RepID=A0ABQ0G8T5_9PEZI